MGSSHNTRGCGVWWPFHGGNVTNLSILPVTHSSGKIINQTHILSSVQHNHINLSMKGDNLPVGRIINQMSKYLTPGQGHI